ncbi:hypothetical protein ABZ897_38470 [Nonomuraea sp. NPDC046802]|uniref:hypothetical protein n=1 Tax=Nonomuraea sp. NPDC046802 TaxID=3154919 RepID=UPI00340D5D23
MKGRAQVALALVAGYYLGRRRKLRCAAALAMAGVAGALRQGNGGGLLKQGLSALGTSPEIERLTGKLRGELMEVGKAAAIAAATRQVDSLTEKIHGRADSLRRAGRPRAEEEPEEEEEYGPDEDEYEEEPPEEEPRARRPRVRRAPVSRERR